MAKGEDLDILNRLDEEIDKRKNRTSKSKTKHSSKRRKSSPATSFSSSEKQQFSSSETYLTPEQIRNILERLSEVDSLMAPVFESLCAMVREDIHSEHGEYFEDVIKSVLKLYFPDSALQGRNEIVIKEDTKKRVPFLHEGRKRKLLKGKVGKTIEIILEKE